MSLPPQDAHATLRPSPWVVRWAGALPPDAEALDLACGAGRHSRLLASLGHKVCAVDRDPAGLANLANVPGVETMVADLETGSWPFGARRFGAIVVTNYLHRPLFRYLLDAIADDGVLIYETFALGNERFGRPSNPDFLLRPGELLEVVRGRLRVLAFEEGEVAAPRPAMMQRLCACGMQAAPLLR